MKFLPARQHHASFAGSRRTDRSVSVFTQISATLSLFLVFPKKGTKLCAPRFVKQADPRLSVARLRKTSEPDCKLTEPPHRVPFTFRKVHLRPMARGRQPLGELGEKMEITSTHKTFRQKKACEMKRKQSETQFPLSIVGDRGRCRAWSFADRLVSAIHSLQPCPESPHGCVACVCCPGFPISKLRNAACSTCTRGRF